MTKFKISLPWFAQLNLREEELTLERTRFIVELILFIGGEWDLPANRIYFDRRGAYIPKVNSLARPWRYNARGLAQAKEEISRGRAALKTAKTYLAPDSALVQDVVTSYRALGWGWGSGGAGQRDWSVKGLEFRFIRRGRWYSLEEDNIRQMRQRAEKARKILAHFAKVFSLDQMPEHLRPLCVDVRKHVCVVEETGMIVVRLGTCNETFPATPRGIYAARFALVRTAQAYLAKA